MWSIALDPPWGRRSRRSARKSPSQSLPQKNTAVPSGASTAVRSASPAPRRRSTRGASSARRALGARVRVAALDGHGDDLRVAGAVVEHHPHAVLLPQLHRLGAVRAGVREAHRAQQRLGVRGGVGVDAELDEREPVELRGRGELVLEHDQRAHGVDRGARRVGRAEDVVEDLEAQRAVVAGGEHAPDEAPRRRARPGRGSSGSGGSTAGRPSTGTARRRAGGRRLRGRSRRSRRGRCRG